jgi:hypothetical protein
LQKQTWIRSEPLVLILLDENLLSKKLKKPLVDAGHSVKNVDDMGWRGTKDSELLALADVYPFDGFITADKKLPHQQKLRDLAKGCGVGCNEYTSRSFTTFDKQISKSGLLQSLDSESVTFIDDAGDVIPFIANSHR